MSNVSFEIQQQIIKCFGECFHYKETMEIFLRTCDVPENIIQNGRENYKKVWASEIIKQLKMSKNGEIIIRKIATEFYKLNSIPQEVDDKERALSTLNDLKIMIRKSNLVENDNHATNSYHRKKQDEKLKVTKERDLLLSDLKLEFYDEFNNKNVQERGYKLEKIISRLFKMHGIKYEDSYRNDNNTQQMDGEFNFEGFNYLVECKWVSTPVNASDIASLKHKVDTKLESTRGFFISINGFRDEVIGDFSNSNSKILFMDGQDLTFILEKRVSIEDALNYKITEAAKTGNTFAKLQNVLI